MKPPPIPTLQMCKQGVEYFVSFRSYVDQPIFGSAVMCIQMKQLMKFYAQYRARIGHVMCTMPRVRIRAYCLLPESYTILITPVVEGGVEYFCSIINEAISAYYAVLFKSPKRVLEDVPVVSEVLNRTECLSAVRYIDTLPILNDGARDGNVHSYPWCSLYEIMTEDRDGVVDESMIAEYFPDMKAYVEFIQSGKV